MTQLEPITYGQGNAGFRCSVCYADDYWGQIEHAPGCEELAPKVAELRERAWEIALRKATDRRNPTP